MSANRERNTDTETKTMAEVVMTRSASDVIVRTAYAAAKGGLIAFTKSLAREVARFNINVNCVCPGPTDTPLLNTRSDKLKEAFIKAIAFRRLGKPEEIGKVFSDFQKYLYQQEAVA